MKKYLNKNLFYQGDASIILLLLISYIGTFTFLKLTINSWLDYNLTYRLYGDIRALIIDSQGILIFIVYIIIIYMISVGIFKKKKWSTLLSGPFTRRDIRGRELTIVTISALMFILLYLIIIGQGAIQYSEIISYVGEIYFLKIVLIDLVRIISLAFISIGGLFFLDSFFVNLYLLASSIIFTFIYGYLLMWNSFYSSVLIYSNDNIRRIVTEAINSFFGYYYNYEINNTYIIVICIIMIATGIILGYCALKLTDKMKVENMNEGILFNIPKKIGRFMICTVLGLLLSPIIAESINRAYFNFTASSEIMVTIRIVVFIAACVISVLVMRQIEVKLNKKILS